MAEDPKQFDRELDELENAINLLKREFEKFFGGGSKRPPTDQQARLEKAVKKSLGGPALTYAQRYRYNTIVARFNTYNELWNKQLRLKEEGKFQTGPQGPALAAHAPRPRTENPKQDAQERIYQDYLNARAKTGEGTPQINPEGFAQIISKQRQALIDKFNCKDVQFYVTVEEGKTKLKAKPIK